MTADVEENRSIAIVLGGGDIASGAALRLHRCGIPVLVTELARPLAIRRLVAFAEAIYAGSVQVEDVTGRRIDDIASTESVWGAGEIAVIADETASSVHKLQPLVVVDGRMIKKEPDYPPDIAPLIIGLGPGFTAGENCHAVVETNRGHNLGRVSWNGSAEADTGIPEAVLKHQADRVIRAPVDGVFHPIISIGEKVKRNEGIARVDGTTIQAPFDGVIRGLLHDGIEVRAGFKVGDVDPRNDPSFARLVSDKSLAVGGGVLEAIFSMPEIRRQLWE